MTDPSSVFAPRVTEDGERLLSFVSMSLVFEVTPQRAREMRHSGELPEPDVMRTPGGNCKVPLWRESTLEKYLVPKKRNEDE